MKSYIISFFVSLILFKGFFSFVTGSDLVSEAISFASYFILLFVSLKGSFLSTKTFFIFLFSIVSSFIISNFTSDSSFVVSLGDLFFLLVIYLSFQRFSFFEFTRPSYWKSVGLIGILYTFLELALGYPLSSSKIYGLGAFSTSFLSFRLSSFVGSATTFSVVCFTLCAVFLFLFLYVDTSKAQRSLSLSLCLFYTLFAFLTFNRGIMLAYFVALLGFGYPFLVQQLRLILQFRIRILSILVVFIALLLVSSVFVSIPELSARLISAFDFNEISNFGRISKYIYLVQDVGYFSIFGQMMGKCLTVFGSLLGSLVFPFKEWTYLATESSVLYFYCLTGYLGLLPIVYLACKPIKLSRSSFIQPIYIGILVYCCVLQLFDTTIFLLCFGMLRELLELETSIRLLHPSK